MIHRWLLYLACLGAAILFYIFDTGYFSFVLLVLGIAFLPIELAISLPGVLAVRVTIKAHPAETRGGGPFVVQLQAGALRPLCSVRARLVCQNLLDGSEKKLRLRLPMGPAQSYDVTAYGAGIGALRFGLLRLRVVDVAGLFAFPLRAPGPVMVLALPALPVPAPVLPEAALDQGSLPQHTATRPGPDAMREFTDIREYRQGDSLRDVHWKLTAKFNKVMVREGNFSSAASPQLYFDYHGEVGQVAVVLGRLECLSRALCAIERLHGVHWLNADGVLHSHLVASQSDFDALLWTLLETPLPADGPAILQHPPEVPGPKLLVKAGSTELYDEGRLLEVVD